MWLLKIFRMICHETIICFYTNSIPQQARIYSHLKVLTVLTKINVDKTGICFASERQIPNDKFRPLYSLLTLRASIFVVATSVNISVERLIHFT
jgi:hypothetical protein